MLQVSQTEFYVDWHNMEVCVKKGKRSYVRTDFAISLIALVEAGCLTGFQARVGRQLDRKTRHVISDVVVVFVVQHHSSIAVANHISVVFQCIVHSVYNRVCYFTSDGIYNTSKFLVDINKSFGSGGMSAWFRDKELYT